MKAWFSAAELAGLPGLPGTERSINRMAERESWPSQPRAGRGGGREYAYSSLPDVTQQHLLAQHVSAIAETLPAVIDTPRALDVVRPAISELKTWQRQVMDARLTIVTLIDELAAEHGRAPAVAQILSMARSGALPPGVAACVPVANARSGKLCAPSLDRSTLYRWMKLRDTQGAQALAPASARTAAVPTWLPQLLSLYQRPQKPALAACLRAWREAYPDQPVPPQRTAERWIASLPVEVREYGRLGRNALRAVQPFVRRTTDGLWPMDIVTVDGHLFKGYVKHPSTGRKFRPELTCYLDVATRRAVGFSAWIAESTFAIWCALRPMVMDPALGIPAMHYSDNGAYRSDSHRATLARIGTTIMFAQAYRAQARGLIERFNSSVWIPLARTLPTYCGDDADPEHLKRELKIANSDDPHNLPGWQEFVNGCRAELDAYNNRPHASLGKKTPNEAWALALADGWRPTPLDHEDLHDVLPSTERKVNRGEVNLPWGKYGNNDLALHHGRRVRVAYDPTNGEQAWISDLDGQLICIAQRGWNEREYVHGNQVMHAQSQREEGRVKRLEKKLVDVREEGALLLENLPDAMLPMDFATKLADTVPVTISAPAKNIGSIAEDPRRNYAYWCRLDDRVALGETLSEEEQRIHRGYPQSIEWSAQRELFEAFEMKIEDWA